MSRFVYYPSCNFTKASPEAARRLQAYLEEKMPVRGCCRVEPRPLVAEETGVYFCQACRETLEEKFGDAAGLQNLFVYLTEQEDFPWPDYAGLTVNVQDCWRDRAHPEIHRAVRRALGNMGVQIVELEQNREKSTFCGNLHLEPRRPELRALLEQHPDTPLFLLPEDLQAALMREQVETYTAPLTVTYCNRCTRGIELGGGKAAHLVELLTGTY